MRRPSRPLRTKIALIATISMLILAGILYCLAELRDSWTRARFISAMARSDETLIHTIQSLEADALAQLNRRLAADINVGDALVGQGSMPLERAHAAVTDLTVDAASAAGVVLLNAKGAAVLAVGASIENAAVFTVAVAPLLGESRRFDVAVLTPDGVFAQLVVSEARRGAKTIGYVVSFNDLGARLRAFHSDADTLGARGLDQGFSAINGDMTLLDRVSWPCCALAPEGRPVKIGDALYHSVAIPLFDLQGAVAAEVFSLREITQSRQHEQRISLLAWIAAIMTSLLSIGLMLRALRVALRPLGAVVKLLRRMSDGETHIGLKSQRSAQEIEALVETVDDFRASLQAQKSLAALTEQLENARRLQQSLLPQAFDLEPRLDLYGAMRPAQDVGGDFFDVFTVGAGRVAVIVADVSGKGISAALFAALASAALRANARVHPDDPAAAMKAANEELCVRNHEDMFLSVLLAVIDPATGDVAYANAGHCPPFLIGENEAQSLEAHGDLVLGVMPGMDYGVHRLTLQLGEALMIYTDGFDEAERADHAQIGTEGALEIAQRRRETSAEALVGAIFTEIDAFADGAPQADDITLFAIQRASHGARSRAGAPQD